MFFASEAGARSLGSGSKSLGSSCWRKFVSEKLPKFVGSQWSRTRWWKAGRFARACRTAFM